MAPAKVFSPPFATITISRVTLPEPVRDAVEAATGASILGAYTLRGGQVSPAARADTAAGSVFVKWEIGSDANRFALEAEGLKALAATQTLRVPEIIATQFTPASRESLAFGYLILEFIPNAKLKQPILFSRRFGEALADLHHRTAADHPPFGLDYSNFLGSQPQKNQPRSADWTRFYRDNRLLPQIQRARANSLLPVARYRSLLTLIDNLGDLLEGMPASASLIHGDLWSGNFLCAEGDEPVLIDPAIYYGPREMEIAYVELFGGFPPRFVDNYAAVYPLDSGYARRRSLHQLYPLLIHLNHFGEEYGPAVDRVCAEYRNG